MKKSFIIIVFLLGIAFEGFSQPQFDSVSFPNSVNLFDKFEVSIKLGNSYTNPYDPNEISIIATFYSPTGQIYKVNAFYFDGYYLTKAGGLEHAEPDTSDINWKIRFTPNQIGAWRFSIQASDVNGTSYMPNSGMRRYNFTCNSVNNADGFISKANSRFLKREVVRYGQRQFKSYFPIGPNVAWYDCYPYTDYTRPIGIYYYKRYIDSLSGNANYMRIFLNRYQFLSLYGPEYAPPAGQSAPIVYFDSTINQKDSAELDYIIEYAAQHDVTVMPCIFSFGDFSEDTLVHHSEEDSSTWRNNPFHTHLGLPEPCNFFSDTNAINITKNLLRYIVSRWGYSTNIMCWELWNEVSNMFIMRDEDNGHLQDSVLLWHNEMAHWIRKNDPYKHCVSTSMGTVKKTNTTSHINFNYPLYLSLFDNLDIVQQHNYQNINKAASIHQISKILYDTIAKSHTATDFPTKPFFMGEFGFGNGANAYMEKDSCGIDLHNSLWSSLFSAAIGPASIWWWAYLENCKLFHNRYAPLLTFCQNMPILSETFTAHHTGQEIGHKLEFPPNNIQTYYMINATEDTIYGWCQDTAFAYQSLRWLTDSVQTNPHKQYYMHFIDSVVFDSLGYVYKLKIEKRPNPSCNSNIITIPITHWSVGISYEITWYNTETGIAYPFHSYATIYSDGGNKYASFKFPSAIRDVNNHVINNTFGDVAFSMVILKNNNVDKNKD